MTWRTARAFKNKGEAEAEKDRLKPFRKGFELQVVLGDDPIYPHELQYRRKGGD